MSSQDWYRGTRPQERPEHTAQRLSDALDELEAWADWAECVAFEVLQLEGGPGVELAARKLAGSCMALTPKLVGEVLREEIDDAISQLKAKHGQLLQAERERIARTFDKLAADAGPGQWGEQEDCERTAAWLRAGAKGEP